MSAPPFRYLLSAPAPGTARAGAAAWDSASASCYVGPCEYALRLAGSAAAAEDVVHDLGLPRGYREIAMRLGGSVGTVKSQMWRATVRLKERLAPHLAPPVTPTSRHRYRVV